MIGFKASRSGDIYFVALALNISAISIFSSYSPRGDGDLSGDSSSAMDSARDRRSGIAFDPFQTPVNILDIASLSVPFSCQLSEASSLPS